MHMSPGWSWLTGVALSGIFLAGSVFVPSTSKPLVIHPVKKPVILASVPTNITQSSQSQVHRNTVKSTIMTTTGGTKHAQTENHQIITKSTSNSPETVHIAQVAPQKTQSEIKQVSRGSSAATTIVEHALSLLGTPYVYGGTTRSGFDCSGFTQYVFAGSGISLPRTSYEQFASGVAVSRNELQPGDLVFFTIYTKGASHVGIYIGGGRFIHADNPRVGVTITSLSNSFYFAHYLGARKYD